MQLTQDADRLLVDLNPEQRRAVEATSGPVCILAGAGTGKTRTLTRRVAYGAAIGAMDPGRTLVVTFTRHAAGEMRQRLQALGVDGVNAATFHSAALAQLRHFWPLVRSQPLPQVLDSSYGVVARAAKPILNGAERYTPTRDLVAEIEWAKVRRIGPRDYAARAIADGRDCPIDPERFARLYGAYELAKERAGRIDFADMLGILIDLLREHETVRAMVRERYAHFSVDEYQDTSPLQDELLELWLDGRREVAVVGDPEQTIFSFAGASADFLATFRRRHPDATVVSLVRNYRSSPEIVAIANRLNVPLAGPAESAAGAAPARRGTLIAEMPSGPAVRYVAAQTADDELDALIGQVAAVHKAGVPNEEIAILVRLTAVLPPIEAALARAGIAYRTWGDAFFERPDVRRIREDLARHARRDPDAVSRAALLSILADRFNYDPRAPVVGGEAAGRAAAAETLLGLADGQPALGPFAAELDRLATDEAADRTGGVNLLTIHRAKGLEWDAVLLPCWEEGSLPVRQALGAPDSIAEERRLAYVAVTRARRHLWLSSAARRPSASGNETTRKPSRFLGAAGLLEEEDVTPRARATRRVTVLPGAPTAVRVTLEGPLAEALRTWRTDRARRDEVPAYVVAPNETLAAIAEARPSSLAALRRCRGMGERRLELYGEEILAVVQGDHRA